MVERVFHEFVKQRRSQGEIAQRIHAEPEWRQRINDAIRKLHQDGAAKIRRWRRRRGRGRQ
jgi:hypothetical protein